MTYYLYVVYDCVAEEAGPLFQAKNEKVAFRMFEHMLAEVPESTKDDYKLVLVGEINGVYIESYMIDLGSLSESENKDDEVDNG